MHTLLFTKECSRRAACGMACMRERAGWSSGCFIRDDDSSRVVKTLQADDRQKKWPTRLARLARESQESQRLATAANFLRWSHVTFFFKSVTGCCSSHTQRFEGYVFYSNRTGKRLLLSLWHFLRAFLPTAEARDRETAARMAAPRCSERTSVAATGAATSRQQPRSGILFVLIFLTR